MTAISKSRKNPWTGAVSWRDAVDTDYEELTVAEFSELPGIYGVQLQDHPTAVTMGLKRVSGLIISSITNPAGNTYRYNFSGTPDLSTVIVGDYLHAKDCTNAANNIKKVITAVSDASDYIEVTNASGVAQGAAGGECAVSSAQYTQVSSGSPAALQYRPDYSGETGKVLMHPDEDTNIVIVNYQAGGTVIQSGVVIGTSYIILDTIGTTTAGWGSANTKVARFANLTTVGSDLTATQSATNGDSIAVNTAGGYLVEAGGYYDNSGVRICLVATKNTNDGTTDPIASTINGIFARSSTADSSPDLGGGPSLSRVIVLSANDVIRIHGRGSNQGIHAEWYFQIMRLW